MKKKPLPGDDAKTMYKQRHLDRVHRFLMASDTVRGFLVRGDRLVRELRANHGFGPLETMVAGQGAMGALLMAANLKDAGKVRLQWESAGPVGGMSFEADSHGAVRGFLKNNPIVIEEKGPQFTDLFGPGFLTVSRLFEKGGDPMNGTVALRYGKIAEDLAIYHLESEQIPTAMALSVAFDENGESLGAGGLFLQALPGADENVLDTLEEALNNLPSLGEAFASGQTVEEYIEQVFSSHSPRILSSKRVEFFCPCDSQLFARYMKGLSQKDQKEIREKGPFPLEITCQNCASVYSYSQEDIQKLLG